MRRALFVLSILCLSLFLLSSCGEKKELADMRSGEIEGKYAVFWEGRTYTPFCVVEKSSCGEQIGYVDGNRDDRISEYKGYPAEEWLVSWIPMDGGAILLKEENAAEIPEGLEREYE